MTDQQGGAIPGVIVLTTHIETGEIRSFVTDASGQYVARDLTPGRYTVRFELIGFARVERSDLLVQPGRTIEVNSQLNVSQLSEILQVEGIAPHVDTRSTLVTHNVTAEQFERIPKGRSFQSIAVTAPSVNQGDIEGGLQVNGASGSENQFTVDGVATNSLLNGQSRQNTVFEYLQEVQVKTVGIPAEFGGALGGVISAVTKSGSNTFRGETHYYYLGSGLSAGPVKRLVLSPVDEQTVSYVQDPKPADHRHEIGGSLGGPIVRGQLFFFGSMSPRFRHRIYDYKFDNGLSRAVSKHASDPQRVRKSELLAQPLQHVCRCLVDADLLRWHPDRLQRAWAAVSVEHALQQPTEPHARLHYRSAQCHRQR